MRVKLAFFLILCRILPCLKHITQRERSEVQLTGSSSECPQSLEKMSLSDAEARDERNYQSKTMLAKKNRLTSKDLKEVRGFSFYRSDLFDIKDFRDLEAKYAVIVGAKVYKKAVERNKVKRLFYRILGELLNEYPVIVKHSCAFFPKKGILDKEYTVIKNEVTLAIKQKYV